MSVPPAAIAPSGISLQHDALQLYIALSLHRETWAGALLLGTGLDEPGRALALASLAAGAAALFIEHEPANLRIAQREGCCTFTVTTLPEAIRILKNEVRQSRPITVALRSPADQALQEVVRRGLQPAAFAFSRSPSAQEVLHAQALRTRGADWLSGFSLASAPGSIDLQAPVLTACDCRWILDTDHAVTRAERVQRDEQLLVAANATNYGTDPLAPMAARWLHVSRSLFPRALNRALLQRTV